MDPKVAKQIRDDKEMTLVLEQSRTLLKDGLNAGSGYNEVWIRDLNTFIELALDVRKPDEIRDSLLVFFDFQGDDGNIIDGYVPKTSSNVNYKYRQSKTRPDLLGHKNTVETDQETSLIQAVARYIRKTGDKTMIDRDVYGQTVRKRLERAMTFLMEHRFDKKHGLLWGATTVDWGDVQPEHSWGVEIDKDTHRAIDIYDNAMFITAIRDYLSIVPADAPEREKWEMVAADLRKNAMKHLWDAERKKFRPHVYLEGSPFPADFDEESMYYHGGTAAAIEAGLLSHEQIGQVIADMRRNVKLAKAASVGLTNWPPYPKGFFKNEGMVPCSYQNAGDWTWWGGRIIQHLTANGYSEAAYEELRPMLLRVIKNKGFYEWYTVKNEPRGSGKFRGSAGVLGKAILMLREEASTNHTNLHE